MLFVLSHIFPVVTVVVGAAFLFFLGLLLATVLKFPSAVIKLDEAGSEGLSVQLKARNDVRTALLQGFASILLLAGAGVAFWQLQTSQQELRTSAEGQQTERFSRAVEQLAAENDRAVQLGGIYTLVDLASQDRDRSTVVARILASYVQQHAPQPASVPVDTGDLSPLTQTRPDLQACLDFLTRLPGEEILSDLVLEGVALKGVMFEDGKAWLEAAQLKRADLTGARIVGGRLAKADLAGAWLSRANLTDADLEGARLAGAAWSLQTYRTRPWMGPTSPVRLCTAPSSPGRRCVARFWYEPISRRRSTFGVISPVPTCVMPNWGPQTGASPRTFSRPTDRSDVRLARTEVPSTLRCEGGVVFVNE